MPKTLIATCAALLLIATPAALGEADYLDAAALHDAGLVKY